MNQSKVRAITQKILLQMNCKLGGTLWNINIPYKTAMVIGIDAHHDVSRKKRSVCGMYRTIFICDIIYFYLLWELVKNTEKNYYLFSVSLFLPMQKLAVPSHASLCVWGDSLIMPVFMKNEEVLCILRQNCSNPCRTFIYLNRSTLYFYLFSCHVWNSFRNDEDVRNSLQNAYTSLSENNLLVNHVSIVTI